MLAVLVIVSLLTFAGCVATRRAMEKIRGGHVLDGWERMSNAQRDEVLRHPCWKRRCLCRLYGCPWDRPMVVIGRDGTVHEDARCFPIAERL